MLGCTDFPQNTRDWRFSMQVRQGFWVVGFVLLVGVIGLFTASAVAQDKTTHSALQSVTQSALSSDRALSASGELGEPDVPLNDLWEQAPPSTPTSFAMQSATGFGVVLVLVLVFFRFVFPYLAKKNPQWKQKRVSASSSLLLHSNKDGDLPTYRPEEEEPVDLNTFLKSVQSSQATSTVNRDPHPIETNSPVGYTQSMSSSVSIPSYPSAPSSSGSPGSPMLGLPLNTLPLTVIREFVVGQGVRLQLVTVWDRYLVILQAADGVELVGEVQCDRDAGYVRFEETIGAPSERIAWLFQYHASSIQQCVDTVAKRESKPDSIPTEEPLKDTLSDSHPQDVKEPYPHHQITGSSFGDTINSLDSHPPANAQPGLGLPLSASNSQVDEMAQTEPVEWQAVSEPPKDVMQEPEGVYLKYIAHPPKITEPQFSQNTLTNDNVDDDMVANETVPEASSSLSPFSKGVQQDLEALPKPWYAQPSSEELLQSRALKDTLNQMIHEVLEAEMRGRQLSQFDSPAASSLNVGSSLVDDPKALDNETKRPSSSPGETSQTLFDDDDRSLSSVNLSSTSIHHPAPEVPSELEEAFEQEALLNLVGADVVVEHEPLPVRESARPSSEGVSAQSFNTSPLNTDAPVVLGELDLDAPLPQLKRPADIEVDQVLKQPDNSMPSLTERMALAASASLSDVDAPESLTDAVQQALLVDKPDEDLYPLSGLARRKERPGVVEDSHNQVEHVDPVEASLKAMLYPTSTPVSQKQASVSQPEIAQANRSLVRPPVAQPTPPPSPSLSERRERQQQGQVTPSVSSPRARPAHIPEEIVVLDDYDDTF